MRTYHLRKSKKSGQWELKRVGKGSTGMVIVSAKTKADAIAQSREHLKKLATYLVPVSFRICKTRGAIETEYTYPRKSDPIKSRG